MTKALKTLSRIKKFSIDEHRKALAELFEIERQIIKNIENLEESFLKEKEIAKQIPNFCDFGLYTKFYIKKREILYRNLDEIKKQIAILQDTITAEFKEQKTFDIVEENRAKAQAKEEDQKTQKMLDEIGTNTYIKKQKKENKNV